MSLLAIGPRYASSQQTHVILNDERALVTQIEVSPDTTYSPKDQAGNVWVALDPVVLVTEKTGAQIKRRVRAGDAAIVERNEELQFHVENGSNNARLVIVKPKMAHQRLTAGPLILDNTVEDASDRNTTLLVAVSDARFRDTRNLGNESEWIPSKPSIIAMNSGSVRWILPGTHHFKNLGTLAAKLVSVEW